MFIFTWQELFFATLPDWPYWQKGDKADKSWVGDGSSYGKMLQTRKKSKGRKRVERGQKYGYSNTQRVDGSGLAADASGQAYSKAAAAVPPEPAVPAAEPEVPPAVPAVGTRDPIDVDYVPPAAESNVPRGVLQLAKRAAHGNVTNTPFMRPYAVQPVSRFFLGKDFYVKFFFSKHKCFRKQFPACAV